MHWSSTMRRFFPQARPWCVQARTACVCKPPGLESRSRPSYANAYDYDYDIECFQDAGIRDGAQQARKPAPGTRHRRYAGTPSQLRKHRKRPSSCNTYTVNADHTVTQQPCFTE